MSQVCVCVTVAVRRGLYLQFHFLFQRVRARSWRRAPEVVSNLVADGLDFLYAGGPFGSAIAFDVEDFQINADNETYATLK